MVKTRTVVQTRTHAQKYFQKFSKFEALSGGNYDDLSTSGNSVTKDNKESVLKSTKKSAGSGNTTVKKLSSNEEVKCSWKSPDATLLYRDSVAASFDDNDFGTSSESRLHPNLPTDPLIFPPPINIPLPSPAACGKRKHAELAAAKMLASSSSQDMEGAQVLSMMKGTNASTHSEHKLSINPDFLSSSSDTREPSTPWAMDVKALNSKIKNNKIGILSSSGKIYTCLSNIERLIRSGQSDKLEKALKDLDLMDDSSKGTFSLSNDGMEYPTFRSTTKNLFGDGSPKSYIVNSESPERNPNLTSEILNSYLDNDKTLLMEACVADFDDKNDDLRVEMCRILLTYGCSMFALDLNGNNCLHFAALNGHHKLARIFVNSGSLVNSVNNDGDTALHIAARYGHIKFLDVLFQFGANCHLYNKQNQTALALAGADVQSSSVSRNDIRQSMLKAEPRLRTLVLYHDDCLDHSTRSNWEWEGPDRLRDIMNNLLDTNQFHEHEISISSHFEKASLQLLHRVHSSEYIAFVDSLSQQIQSTDLTTVPFTPQVQQKILHQPIHELKNAAFCDTAFSIGTLQAARRAAGAVAHAVDHVLLGRNRNAFCVVRPPGHHAGYEGLLKNSKSCGFCIFNNVAAGALHALEEHNCERVAIIDVDIHHGMSAA